MTLPSSAFTLVRDFTVVSCALAVMASATTATATGIINFMGILHAGFSVSFNGSAGCVPGAAHPVRKKGPSTAVTRLAGYLPFFLPKYLAPSGRVVDSGRAHARYSRRVPSAAG